MLNADVVFDHHLCHHMTTITWKDGGPVLRGGLVGTEQACCCKKGCEPCYQCAFPAERSETYYGDTPPETCPGDAGYYSSSRGQTYMPFTFVSGVGFVSSLPNYVYWKDGYPAAVSGCNYKIVADTAVIACCAICTVNGITQPTYYTITRYRYRLLAIKCPTETEPGSFIDLTSEALYGDGLQGETSPPETCGEAIGCTTWFDFYDDPTPVCNEFP